MRIKHDSYNDTSSYVDMRKSRSFFAKDLIKKIALPFFIISIMAGVFFFFYSNSLNNQSTDGKIVLLTPRSNQPQKTKEETISRIKNGMAFYFNGEFSSYVKAQAEWIQAIEGDAGNKLAMSYLCLAYYALWPYTNKKSKDIKTVSRITKKINLIDPQGIYSSLCQIVYRLIYDQDQQVNSIISSSIEIAARYKHSENILPFFYYLKGQFYIDQQQHKTSLVALESAKTLLPEMVGIDIAFASAVTKQRKWSKALNIYSLILSKNPQHKLASLNKGVILYEHLRKKEEGIKIIESALSWKEPILPHHLAPVYLVLAKNALQQNNKEKFLEYGKKSYALDPTNKEFHQLLKKSGLNQAQQSKLKESTNVNSESLIQQGDQLEREGLFLKARSYYQKAFKADKNVSAAVKISKNLWKFGLIDGAISWLKKAISTDPTHIKSYILLSDYYAQLYDFDSASQILKTANTHSPNNTEILKGYALLLLKKDTPQLSMHYIKKALAIYESDVESYVILSQVHEASNEPNLSLSAIRKALEIDSNNQAVQIQYARAIGTIYGTESAVQHLTKFISQSQDKSQRYVDYILALSQFLYDKKKYYQARSILLNLDKLKEKPIKYHLLMGKIYLQHPSTLNKAYEELVTASVISPSDPKIMFYLSSTLLKTKQYDASKNYADKILKSYPRYPRIHYRLAEIFHAKGGIDNLKTAIEKIKTEQQLNPNMVDSYQLAGNIYYALEEYVLCARNFQKAIELTPDHSGFYVQVARCYRKSGDLDLAIQMLKAVSQHDKDGQIHNPDVYKEFGKIYELKKDYLQATKSYRQYLKSLPPGSKEGKEIERQIQKLQ